MTLEHLALGHSQRGGARQRTRVLDNGIRGNRGCAGLALAALAIVIVGPLALIVVAVGVFGHTRAGTGDPCLLVSRADAESILDHRLRSAPTMINFGGEMGCEYETAGTDTEPGSLIDVRLTDSDHFTDAKNGSVHDDFGGSTTTRFDSEARPGLGDEAIWASECTAIAEGGCQSASDWVQGLYVLKGDRTLIVSGSDDQAVLRRFAEKAFQPWVNGVA